jgi:hypothetical protein
MGIILIIILMLVLSVYCPAGRTAESGDTIHAADWD